MNVLTAAPHSRWRLELHECLTERLRLNFLIRPR